MQGVDSEPQLSQTVVPGGSGEMGERIAGFDWSQTPLGASQSWPSSLRTALNICLTSSVPMAIWWGPELTLLYNDAWRPLLGAAAHPQALGRPGPAIDSDLWGRVGPLVEEVISTGQPLRADDGQWVVNRYGYTEDASFTWSYSPLHDGPGQPSGVFATVTKSTERFIAGIIERKRVEEALRASEVRYQALTELVPSIIWTAAPDGTITYVNEQWYRFCGITPDQNARQWPDLVLHPDDRERCVTAWRRALAEGSDYMIEVRNRRYDGEYRWFLTRAVPLRAASGQITAWFGCTTDIHDQKQSQESIRLAAEADAFRVVLADALGALTDPLAIQGAAALVLGQHLAADRAAYGEVQAAGTTMVFRREYRVEGMASMLGSQYLADYGPTLLAGLRAGHTAIVDDVQTAPFLQARAQATHAALSHRAFVMVPLIMGGQLIAVALVAQATPRSWTTGETALIAETVERTWVAVEQARAAAALQISETRLRMAVEAAAIGIWDIDLRNGVRTWSDQARAIYGVAADEILDYERQLELVHPDDRAQVQRLVSAFRDEGTLNRLDMEHRIVRPDGSLCWVAVRGEAIYDHGPLPVRLIGTLIDITERKRTEESLRERETRYRQLADAMPQLVWSSDSAGVVDYYNSRIAEYDGALRTADGSWSWQPMLHPDDIQPTQDAWVAASRHGQPYAFEHRIRMRNGSFRWHLSRALPAIDDQGRIIKWFGTATDIHAQKQVERDSRFLADIGERIRLADDTMQLLDQVAEAVGSYLEVRRCLLIEMDLGHNRALVRSAFCQGVPPVAREYAITDYSEVTLAEIIAGHTVVNHDAQHDPRTAAIYDRTYRTYGERAYIAVPLMRDGQLNGSLWVSDDAPRHWEAREIAVLETVAERVWLATERLRAEQALRANEERLQVLYAEEQAARAQAEAASRLKDEFLATVSHELRTPLTSILGFAMVLQSRKRDEAYIARTIEKIVRSAKAQAQLIEDLLDVSRIVTGKLRIEPRPLDMVAVIQAAVETLRPAIDARAIQLHSDLRPDVGGIIGDPNRLQQVVWNLLSNAVKFTPAGGSIWLRLEAHDGQAQITVSDTGQGISAEFLPYVFDRFRQAENTSTRLHGGLGLGLSIVRHLVEMHGGTVQAQSAGPGAGATFTVRLPLAAGAERASAEPARAQDGAEQGLADLKGVRVLLVDDQPDILDLLAEMLVPCGALVRGATTAQAALEILGQWRPDVLISDIAMPGTDGYWLIDKIRTLPAAAGGAIPAVALTAYVRVEDRVRVLASGFQLYVPKPVEPTELRDAVARLVEAQATDQS